MTTAHIAKFAGGEIHITTGGGSHSETRVTYTASSGLSPWSGNIVGTLEDNMIPNRLDVQTVDIGNTVTEIYNDAFDGCSGLTTVTIPDSVTSISGYVFNNCTSLSSITILYANNDYNLEVGESIFAGCDNLHTISCPNMDSTTLEWYAQMSLIRFPSGEGDYIHYVASDGDWTIVASYDSEYDEWVWAYEEREEGEQP